MVQFSSLPAFRQAPVDPLYDDSILAKTGQIVWLQAMGLNAVFLHVRVVGAIGYTWQQPLACSIPSLSYLL